ncbi:olfactory receptor 2D2-like [Ambystoma mexicanum]|uniref:olfactory receptor 2D2-like n=1 Tax=Ambystoma mexicanum TaxID=8296 RepID=UPI0037E7F0C9
MGLENFSVVYLDSISGFSHTWEDHLITYPMKQVLQALQNASLTIKATECQIAQGTVSYLRHLVGGGKKPSLKTKVLAVKKWDIPTTQTQVRAFLGLTGYYRSFIIGYGTIAMPLNDVTSKNLPKKIIERDVMENPNETQVTEFILLGFSYYPHTKLVLFAVLLVVYLFTLTANSLFILATVTDARLHSPMYFFLCNLSFLDLCYSSISGPTILQGLMRDRVTIIYAQCITQMYIGLSLGETECFLLAVMAWDRYVAICIPLHYQQIMTTRACIKLAILTWAGGFLMALSSVVVLPVVHFCGHNIIDHIVCEAEALSRLTCMDVHYSYISSPALALLSLLMPLLLILFTYVRIITTILRMPMTESRHRTFSTCGSHLVLVTLFYGTAMVIYVRPKSRVSSEKHKALALFYGQVVPAFNPLIYTLRNKKVIVSLKNFYNKTISY